MAAEGFQFDGVKYEMSSLSLKEAREIQRATGFTPVVWDQKIGEVDAEAITALVWIARRRNGEPNLRFEDVDGDLASFMPLEDPDAPDPESEQGPDFPGVDRTPSGPLGEAG